MNQILKYDRTELKNFNLLNNYTISVENSSNQTSSNNEPNIIELQKQMDDAIEKEDYELANELQKKIDKLNNKEL